MSNFWDRSEMNKMMNEYKDLCIINVEDKSIKLKPGVDKRTANIIYEKIYKKHSQMAEVVLPTNRNRNRISGCTSRLYEAMMFHWDSEKTENSYGYMYRTAYLYSVDWISGKVDGSMEIFSKKKSTTKRHKFNDCDIPPGMVLADYARYLAQEELGWGEWTLRRDEHNECWDISYKETSTPIMSFDSFERPMQIQDLERSSSISNICDQLDWQILSEYIPDVSASQINKEIAYVFLEVMRELIEDHPETIKTRRAFGTLVFELIKSRMPIHITRQRIADVRHIVRQAYRYYSEDYIEQDDFVLGSNHGVSFDS